MSNHAEQDGSRLRLDRANRKLLGVCGGLARYLDVPPALVRVIYCIACLASPILLLAYFILYWLLEDEERPDRIKSALSGFTGIGRSNRTPSGSYDDTPPPGQGQSSGASTSRKSRSGSLGMDIFNGTLYRSRKNVWIGGVCSGIANYLGIRTVIVRALTLVSLFVLGGVTVWGYVILWIILDKEPKRRRQSATASSTADVGHMDSMYEETRATPLDMDTCAQTLKAAERRLRNVEAYMTSKQFRLHCEINRI